MDPVTTDALGNQYIVITMYCIHFTKFVGFSAQSIAHEHWLEARIEEQARRAEEQARQAERLKAAKAASKCYVCGVEGHWARNCPSKHGGGDDEQSDAVDEPESLVKTLELRQAEPKARKRERMPRVLSKAPPRGQKRALEVFEVVERPAPE
jgi:hypothetical protein